jgi:Ser/Thr protein kinase RdoA (MazF antagonist)
MAAVIETGKARLVWSADGSTITKTPVAFWDDDVLGDGRRAFANEQRVNRMLRRAPAPVRSPALVAHRRNRELVVEAIAGDAVGPKFPAQLAPGDLDGMIDLAVRLRAYRPRRRWFRRLEVGRRIDLHERDGLLDASDAQLLRRLVADVPPRLRFAHGDITARNVLRDAGGLVLIDWEWAGLYPEGYDLAFLWFSLLDLEGGRAAVEAVVPETHRRWFLLCALLVQLQHLHMWRSRPVSPFAPRHEATATALLAQVRSLAR